jgi:hypothetical protein
MGGMYIIDFLLGLNERSNQFFSVLLSPKERLIKDKGPVELVKAFVKIKFGLL